MRFASGSFVDRQVQKGLPLAWKPTVHAMDDDFAGSTLDAKWTAVTGIAATANLTETGNVSRYDLSPARGNLLMQAGRNGAQSVKLRQDATLGDGESIIAAMSVAATIDGDPGTTSNEIRGGIAVNNDDSDMTAGTYVICQFQTTSSLGFRINAFNGTTIYSTSGTTGAAIHPGRMYLRIIRSGTSYFPFWSPTGQTWIGLGTSYALGSAMNNVWLYADNQTSHAALVPVVTVDWFRVGGSGVKPW